MPESVGALDALGAETITDSALQRLAEAAPVHRHQGGPGRGEVSREQGRRRASVTAPGNKQLGRSQAGVWDVATGGHRSAFWTHVACGPLACPGQGAAGREQE